MHVLLCVVQINTCTLEGLLKELLFSVTMKDLEMQTFSVGGHGGGGKDTSNSGVRLIQ